MNQYILPIAFFLIALGIVLIVIPYIRREDDNPAEGHPKSEAEFQAEWAAARARQRRRVGARAHARRFHRAMVVRYGRRGAYIRGKVFHAMIGRGK